MQINFGIKSKRIEGFRGEYGFLSNFHTASIAIDGMYYPTTEHAYQALKFGDDSVREYIANLPTPGKAKQFGQTEHESKIPRSQWREMSLRAMRDVNEAKFEIPDLRQKLLSTHNMEIYEVNDWNDKFWGCDANLNGENHLGRILMDIRANIVQEELNKLELNQ